MDFSAQPQGVERFIRRQLVKLEGYTPIVPLEVLGEQAGVPPEGVIKLDGNENPYGCSPRVRQALANYSYYHIYPDPEQRELRTSIGEYVSLSSNYIVPGSGSDELIDLILRLFLQPRDKVINCVPTFGLYPFSTKVCGGRLIDITRDENFAVDVARVKAAIDKRTRIIFIASPNNPSGNTTSKQDILELVETGIVVVIDEAYYEFNGETVAPLVADYDNLIVLRTFSKWAGLAGLRAGYGLFSPKIASYIMKIKPPYNVNVAAQVAAIESLKDLDYLRKTISLIIEERERLFDRLKQLEFLNPLPSRANFILCSVLQGEARKIHQELQRKGIFVRYFDTPLLRNHLRISVGKPEHTEALIEALKGNRCSMMGGYNSKLDKRRTRNG